MDFVARSFRSVIGMVVLYFITATGQGVAEEFISESAKRIPVAYQVDVVIVGGSSGAVSCACEAASQGASVFLLSQRPYVGTDICAKLQLWLEDGELPTSKLAATCFGDERLTTPYKVKTAMDRVLIEAGVSYLTGCYATDVLHDEKGNVTGIVIANRSGRQAIKAKVVIDATEHSAVARLAGARFRSFTPGPQTFRRVVIGGSKRTGESISCDKKDFTASEKHRLPIYEYSLEIEMEDNGVASMLRAENYARNLTYSTGSELASETLYHIPSDTIFGRSRIDSLEDATGEELGAFRPVGIDRLYVLGARADLNKTVAAKLMRPVNLMVIGERIGRAAATEAAGLPAVDDACLMEMNTTGGIATTVGENLDGIRSNNLGTIQAGRQRLPVLGRYDVVVIGGGTSGAPAGIAAAGTGAKTLVVEYLYELGGVGTVGLIGKYWRGLRRGFTAKIDKEVNPGTDRWNAVEKAEWFRRRLVDSSAEVWFGVLACGAIVDKNGQVHGAVVATPWGRGAVLADVTIDATGNADIAAVAGAATQYSISDRETLNVQIAGFPDRPMKNSYVNTCYTMVDDTDVLDVWHLMTWKRVTSKKESSLYDVGQLVDSRERRRIVGDYILQTHDIINHRTFPDTISQHYSNFDAAAFPDADLLLVTNAKGPNFHTDLPYRCLLPKGLDGILVVGLGCSAQRDAMTLIRMQPDLQNQGYAAGLAAVAGAEIDGKTRSVDIKVLQKLLVAEKILDERVLTDQDSYPMSDPQIEAAVKSLAEATRTENQLESLAVIIAHRDKAIPLLKSYYLKSNEETARLKLAQLLAVLGDPTGADTIIEAIEAYDQWDQGIPLTSQRYTGNVFSQLDRLVIALGRSRAPQAIKPLVTKLEQLKPQDALSHYKAISLAMHEYLPCEIIIERLQLMLDKPGFTGFARVSPIVKIEDPNDRRSAMPAQRFLTGGRGDADINSAYKELIIATLLYRCGDPNGSAKAILDRYSQDVHGHFARYARHILEHK